MRDGNLLLTEAADFTNWAVLNNLVVKPNVGYHDVLRLEDDGHIIVFKRKKGTGLETCQRGSRLVRQWRSDRGQQIAA